MSFRFVFLHLPVGVVTRTVLLTFKLELGPQTDEAECLLLVCECNGSGPMLPLVNEGRFVGLHFPA